MNPDSEIPEITSELDYHNPFDYKTEEERKLRTQMSRKAIEDPQKETRELIEMIKKVRKN